MNRGWMAFVKMGLWIVILLTLFVTLGGYLVYAGFEGLLTGVAETKSGRLVNAHRNFVLFYPYCLFLISMGVLSLFGALRLLRGKGI